MTYNLSTAWTVTLLVVVLWELLWKAVALWRAARRSQSLWFMLLIIINSAGILPIVYLLTHRPYHPHVAAARSAV